MNLKFYTLPEEKQRAIINAGYRVFSRNSYKKSPVSEIADAAGISKALLFHYFRNKKELYLFLVDNCVQATEECIRRFQCFDQPDLFEMVRQGLRAKVYLMKRYPDMTSFILKAYYEKDPAVCPELQKIIEHYKSGRIFKAKLRLDPEQFVPGLDLEMMYLDMFWAGEGYIWEKVQWSDVSAEEMERDFERLIDFWKGLYLRKES